MKKNEKELYLGINLLKIQITKMTNKVLIFEWNKIRILNDYCPNIIKFNCTFCDELRNCRDCLVYEELITEELLERGLFDLAINIAYQQREKLAFNPIVRSSEDLS